MNIAISGIGLATAQGNTAQILNAKAPHSPTELLWMPKRWTLSRSCYPALGVDSSLSGLARWQTLIKKALADCLGARPLSRKTPFLVASCNGSAADFQAQSWEKAFDTAALLEGTPWADDSLPVFSASCASGTHALFVARRMLTSGVIDEVLVLAADIISHSNHDNFESLRILAEKPGLPWQSTSQGFILGEAAVVLKLARVETEDQFTVLSGPELRSDLSDHDGLSSVIEALSSANPRLILGQGTGPFQNDTAELSAFSAFIDKEIPLATPLTRFGHTLGASGLLAIALGALIHQTSTISCLANPSITAMDGRPLLNGSWPARDVLATCRALNGACTAAIMGKTSQVCRQWNKVWQQNLTPGPLMHHTLRSLASEAHTHRPWDPPDVLILRMEKPLSPPSSAVIGERLLPSAVLELTPGFASQLIARCWGFGGPALCMVGYIDSETWGLKNACRESGLNVFQVNLRGSGDNRAIEWNV